MPKRKTRSDRSIPFKNTLTLFFPTKGKGPFEFRKVPVSLKVSATLQDWKTLYTYSLDDPESLGTLIFNFFLQPVFDKHLKDTYSPRPRGVHCVEGVKGEEEGDFMAEARRYAAAAYVICQYWLKKDEQPQFFRDLIRTLDKEKIVTAKGKYSTTKATLELFEEKFRERRRQLGLLQKTTPRAFKETYLKRKTNPCLVPAQHFFEKTGHKLTIDELIDYLP